jgi:hypothetical protein
MSEEQEQPQIDSFENSRSRRRVRRDAQFDRHLTRLEQELEANTNRRTRNPDGTLRLRDTSGNPSERPLYDKDEIHFDPEPMRGDKLFANPGRPFTPRWFIVGGLRSYSAIFPIFFGLIIIVSVIGACYTISKNTTDPESSDCTPPIDHLSRFEMEEYQACLQQEWYEDNVDGFRPGRY